MFPTFIFQKLPLRLSILKTILFSNLQGLKTHSEYYMTERDMAHENGNDPEFYFSKNHPNASNLDRLHKISSEESHHTYQYVKDMNVNLYYANSELSIYLHGLIDSLAKNLSLD